VEKIPSAIIGLGRIASLLETDPLREKPCTHAGAIAASGDCFLAGAMDADAGRRELFSSTWGCPVFDSAELMLREIRPRIVHVATHPDTHLEYCLLAEKHGIPVVVCEKPLADTLGRAKKISAIHGRGATKILVNHERRYALDYQRAKREIESGNLGEILGVAAKLYMGKERRIIDMLWHDGTHLVDAVAYLSGGVPVHKKFFGTPLKSARGTAFLLGEIPLRGISGESRRVPFAVEAGAGRDHIVFEIDLSLSAGRVRIGNGVYEIWKSAESPYAKGFRSLIPVCSAFSGPTGYFSRMVEDAARLCRGEKSEPLSGARDALRVIEYLSGVSRWDGR
jgi:predicted dehydrogenase